MLFDNIKHLCEQYGTNFAEVERSCGIGNGVIGKWQTSSPRVETLKKVADYFGMSVDSILADPFVPPKRKNLP